ncbi:MAG: hypothetical protein KAW52_04860 [candidate division Zixibacteria bacterium]|nr:hypothetical protein [candidate division Zixibacteria bacterium]
MKKSTLVLLLGIWLLITGCSKKSTTPEEKPTEDYSLEATQTIGSDGGSIEVDDFSLEVPDGAFSTNVELRLYASSQDQPFGDNGVSRTFRLEGLPDEYSQPLRVRIKYEGTLSNQSYLALGRWVSDPIADTAMIYYGLLSANDSSGYLVCELPAREAVAGSYRAGYHNVNTAGDPLLDNFMVAITDYIPYVSSERRFYIYSPASVAGTVDELAGFLEAAYDTFEQMGFSYYGPEYRYPKVDSVEVNVRDMGKQRSSGWLSPVVGAVNKVDGSMNVNSNIMSQSNLPGMRIEVGRATFDIVLRLYGPGSISGFDTGWLHHASEIWVEEKFTEETNYVPSDFPGQEMDPFAGIGSFIEIEGMAALIKYWVDHYGDNVLVKILGAWADSRVHSIDAVLDNIDDPEYVWWPDFFYEYVSGNIYGVKGDVFSGNPTGRFDINSAADTLKVFTGSYLDLSAKLYRINLNYAHIDTNAQIRFDLSATGANLDYVTITVFSVKDGYLQYLTHSTPELTIKGIKALTQNGNDLLVAVINSLTEEPYTGSRDIDLNVRVISKPELPYNWCRIEFYANMHFSVGDTADFWEQRLANWEGEGAFSGKTFTAMWHDIEVSPGMFSSGNMTVEVDREMPGSFNVVSFYATKTDSIPVYEGTTITSVSGSNIPFDEFDDFYNLFLRCLEEGTEACTRVGSFNYERHFPPYGERVIGYQCNTESEVRIVFWEWHGE